MHKAILLGFLLSFAQTAFSQTITQQEKIQTVNKIADLLSTRYVLIDSGKLMSKKILENLNNGSYDSISGHEEFANQLNKDIRSIYYDQHMGIFYKDAIKEKKREFYRDLKNTNSFEWKVLDGNVGYMDINTFMFHDPKGKRMVNRAMADLANVDFLILDVQDNYGGNANMSNYMAGQFLPPKTQLSTVYKRKGNQLKPTKKYLSKGKHERFQNTTIPIYVLINNQTASAGESLAYELQAFGRATIVGETSAGAAHANKEKSINKSFMMLLPHEKTKNSRTQTDYESTGVVPDIQTKPEEAISYVLKSIK